MKFSAKQFRAWKQKRITLLGMSGVGKTRISNILLGSGDWFHYSADYRIGTRYLDEAILDNIKLQAMQVPFLHDLLMSDSIYIRNNITFNHLKPVSTFLGKLGNPELGGLSLTEFKRRQKLHHDAEIAALLDLPEFIDKARNIYGYNNFINDVGGSICELDDEQVFATLGEHSLILYIEATAKDEKQLIKRAEYSPKPLYYRDEFLDENLAIYLKNNGLEYSSQIEPDGFMRWVFPRLFSARIPRYRRIANKYGYTITTDELSKVRNERHFLLLIEKAIERKGRN